MMSLTHHAREGAASRMIRESEDLSEQKGAIVVAELRRRILRIKKGNPRVDLIRSGFFFARTPKNTFGVKEEKNEQPVAN